MAHMIVFKEEDPDSSSEENCALLAATSSESMTRLLVVRFPSLNESGSKLLLKDAHVGLMIHTH